MILMDDSQEHEAVMETLKLAKLAIIVMAVTAGVLNREILLGML